MRSLRFISLLTALILGAFGAAVSVAGAGSQHPSAVRVVASFNPGQFPEGLAMDAFGHCYVSVTTWGPTDKDPGTGQVVRITAAGKKQPVGPVFDVGFGLLTGVAIGPDHAVYVAVASSQAARPPGIWRIDAAGKAAEVLTLTDGSFPNGLVFRRGRLYVSDSSLGRIWTTGAHGAAVVWSASKLLRPTSANGFGANGIAFRGGVLYVAVTDRSSIVGIPVRSDGSAGKPKLVAHGTALKGADGIAFGRGGALYVATSSSNTLVRLSASGSLSRVAGPAQKLLYPTTPAFASAGASKLYLVSGDFFAKGTPKLLEVPTQ
jgi:SMP-30/Gluconolactonase/LRE-like region